ncbi:MAG: superoxide dismutase family protein [Gammaproteobacteria bacterium]|nr:superoxide dismutase family protein [Gammaproteobacteria bacterium]
MMTTMAYASLKISMYKMDGTKIGFVRADDTIYGLILTPSLYHLPPGVHGFHIYTFPFCKKNAQCAGGHWDPVGRDVHRGPYDAGHLGDLPVLIVGENGKAALPVLVPRLKLEQIKGHALIVEIGGDNYSDIPHENGGEKGPLACGEIPYFN